MPSTPEMRAKVRTALEVVISDFGRDVAAAPDRLRALLADVVGKDAVAARAEIAAVVAAAQAGVSEALSTRGTGGSTSDKALLGKLADVGLDAGMSAFVIDAWANALEVPGLLEGTTPVGTTQPTPDETVLPEGAVGSGLGLGGLDATELPDGSKNEPESKAAAAAGASWYRRTKVVVPVAVASVVLMGGVAAAVALGTGGGKKGVDTLAAISTPSATVTPTPSPTVTPSPKPKVTKKPAPVVKKKVPVVKPTPTPAAVYTAPAPANTATYVPPPSPTAVITHTTPPPPVRIAPTADNFTKSYVPDVLQNGACVLAPSATYSWSCGYPVTVWGHGDWTTVNIVGYTGGYAASTGRGFTFTPSHNGPFTGLVYYTLVDSVTGRTSNTATVTFYVQQNPNIPPGQ